MLGGDHHWVQRRCGGRPCCHRRCACCHSQNRSGPRWHRACGNRQHGSWHHGGCQQLCTQHDVRSFSKAQIQRHNIQDNDNHIEEYIKIYNYCHYYHYYHRRIRHHWGWNTRHSNCLSQQSSTKPSVPQEYSGCEADIVWISACHTTPLFISGWSLVYHVPTHSQLANLWLAIQLTHSPSQLTHRHSQSH